jgi:hypothetical protein
VPIAKSRDRGAPADWPEIGTGGTMAYLNVDQGWTHTVTTRDGAIFRCRVERLRRPGALNSANDTKVPQWLFEDVGHETLVGPVYAGPMTRDRLEALVETWWTDEQEAVSVEEPH